MASTSSPRNESFLHKLEEDRRHEQRVETFFRQLLEAFAADPTFCATQITEIKKAIEAHQEPHGLSSAEWTEVFIRFEAEKAPLKAIETVAQSRIELGATVGRSRHFYSATADPTRPYIERGVLPSFEEDEGNSHARGSKAN